MANLLLGCHNNLCGVVDVGKLNYVFIWLVVCVVGALIGMFIVPSHAADVTVAAIFAGWAGAVALRDNES